MRLLHLNHVCFQINIGSVVFESILEQKRSKKQIREKLFELEKKFAITPQSNPYIYIASIYGSV